MNTLTPMLVTAGEVQRGDVLPSWDGTPLAAVVGDVLPSLWNGDGVQILAANPPTSSDTMYAQRDQLVVVMRPS